MEERDEVRFDGLSTPNQGLEYDEEDDPPQQHFDLNSALRQQKASFHKWKTHNIQEHQDDDPTNCLDR